MAALKLRTGIFCFITPYCALTRCCIYGNATLAMTSPAACSLLSVLCGWRVTLIQRRLANRTLCTALCPLSLNMIHVYVVSKVSMANMCPCNRFGFLIMTWIFHLRTVLNLRISIKMYFLGFFLKKKKKEEKIDMKVSAGQLFLVGLFLQWLSRALDEMSHLRSSGSLMDMGVFDVCRC